MEKIQITIKINAPLATVWDLWTDLEHIKHWTNTLGGWHITNVENDVRNNGAFNFRMESLDGELSFDHKGTYQKVLSHELLSQSLDDGRKTEIAFKSLGKVVEITETFEPQASDPIDLQREFCRSVLNSFKSYAENYHRNP